MHYSQLKKQSSTRKTAHPTTPRPQLENFRPTGDECSFQPSLSKRDSKVTARTVEEHSLFNFKRHGQSSQNLQQRNCGLPKHFSHRVAGVGTQISPTNSSENLPNYLVWVKNEPFDFGILSPLPCPKIGINILRKIAEYCREKPGHFPELSLNQWNHICKYKMQLSIELGFAYFRVFDVLTRPTSTWTEHNNNNLNHDDDDTKHVEIDTSSTLGGGGGGESLDAKFHKVMKQGHDFGEEFKVDTMQFLLFLYIQHFLRLHKKYFVKSYGDEPWPKAWVDNLMQRTGGAGIGANVPEQQQAEFIMANLPDIIDFLMLLHETSEKNSGGHRHKDKDCVNSKSDEHTEQQHQRISVDVIKALSLILGVASTTPNTEFRTLDEILQLPDLRWKLEYSRYSTTVDKKCFIQWVMRNLKINPWGPSSVPIPQVPVSVMTGVWDDVECFKQNKIFWNTQSYPKTWFLISGVEKQVLIIEDTLLEPMSSIKIHRCSNSYVYLPGIYSFILIQKCHGITLNIGVASKVVKFIDCSDIYVSGVGRQFIISDVSQSTFNLLTPSSPLVCGSKNHEISLSPYNTVYPNLPAHMRMADISVKIQRWNRPLEISNDGFPRIFQQANVLPLAAEKFKIFHFPFKADGMNANTISSNSLHMSLPGPLPSVYQRRLDYGLEKMEEARKEFVTKLLLAEEDASLIYQITLQRFKKWLKETGHYDHIVGLRSYQKSLEQGRTLPILCSKGHDLSCVSRALKNFFRVDGSSSAPGSGRSTVSASLSSTSQKSQMKQRHEKTGNVSKERGYRFERHFAQAPRGAGGGGDENKGYGDFFKSSNNNLSARMKKSKGADDDDDVN